MIWAAFQNLFSIHNLLFINIGMFIGIVFGSIPGLNGNLAITVLLPFTFSMDPISAILMLTAIFFGANFGGSISAILINTPGTNAAAATLIDGYPLCHKKGKPQKALDVALLASTFGGIVSALCLLLFAPQISKIAMKFGPPEYFALAIFGLSIIASVSGKSILKGLIMGAFGVLVSTVGLDSVSGIPRFTFHNLNLYNGIGMLAVLLGVYAIAQILCRINKTEEVVSHVELEKNKEDHLTFKEGISLIPTMIKGAMTGAFVGTVPGTGGAIAAYIAYNNAKNGAKKGEKFGEGEIKGIAAPESANNGATAATLIPLLTLGIPGDVVAATLAGAFTMHGLIVGPKLFTDHAVEIYAILLGCLITQLFIFIQGRYLLPIFVKITKVPQDLLTTLLMILCCAGAFAIANTSYDLRVMLIFGVIAYILMKFDFPAVPIVLGIVLGPIAESNFRNAMVMSQGSPLIFLQRPISLLFIILTGAFIVLIKYNEKKQMAENALLMAKINEEESQTSK